MPFLTGVADLVWAPICVNDKLAPFLPGHPLIETGGAKGIGAVNSAPWGSASILLISYAYIRMLGGQGCTDASRIAILNANYLKKRLESHYDILYTGKNDRVAHEFIVDLRAFKQEAGIEVMDIAKTSDGLWIPRPYRLLPCCGYNYD